MSIVKPFALLAARLFPPIGIFQPLLRLIFKGGMFKPHDFFDEGWKKVPFSTDVRSSGSPPSTPHQITEPLANKSQGSRNGLCGNGSQVSTSSDQPGGWALIQITA